MKRPHIVCVRFSAAELEQLRAAVVIQLRQRSTPAVLAGRNLGPFIRQAALGLAVQVATSTPVIQPPVMSTPVEPRNTDAPARARGAP